MFININDKNARHIKNVLLAEIKNIYESTKKKKKKNEQATIIAICLYNINGQIMMIFFSFIVKHYSTFR